MGGFKTTKSSWKDIPENIKLFEDGWTLSTIGDKWHIEHVNDQLESTIYIMPEWFNETIKVMERSSAERTRSDIKTSVQELARKVGFTF